MGVHRWSDWLGEIRTTRATDGRFLESGASTVNASQMYRMVALVAEFCVEGARDALIADRAEGVYKLGHGGNPLRRL